MTPRKIEETEEKMQTENLRAEKKKGKRPRKKMVIVSVIVVLVAAAVVVSCLLINPFGWSYEAARPVPTYPTVPPGVDPPPDVTSVVEPSATSAVAIAQAEEAGPDVFEHANDHIGKTVKISGEIVKEPENNQGMLTIYVQTRDGQYAFVTMLEKGQSSFQVGDAVEVVGLVSAETEIVDASGLLHKGPLLAASKIEAKNKE